MKNIVDFIELAYRIKVRKFVAKFICDRYNRLFYIGII